MKTSSKPSAKKTVKKPANKLTNYFPTRTNFQGFPLSKCRFDETVGAAVFVPDNYGRNLWRENKTCSCCYLKPCITLEYLDQIIKKAFTEHKKRKEAIEAGKTGRQTSGGFVIEKTKTFVKQLLRKHFGKDHVNRMEVLPGCVIAEVYSYTVEWYEDD